jgi:hypothetical protein
VRLAARRGALPWRRKKRSPGRNVGRRPGLLRFAFAAS